MLFDFPMLRVTRSRAWTAVLWLLFLSASFVPAAVIEVTSVTVIDGHTVDVTFDGPLASGPDTTLSNYALSGTGQGTLATQPTAVTGPVGTVYRLVWPATQEMFNGGNITITCLDMDDGINTWGTGVATHSGGAIGVAPVAAMTYSSAGPYKAGAAVTVTATFQEAITGTPQIAIGAPQSLGSTAMTQVSSTVFTYALTAASGDGVATISLSGGTDAAGNPVATSPASGATLTLDATAPTAIIGYSSPGPYAPGAVVTVTANFNEVIVGTPQIAISAPQGISATAMTAVSPTMFTYAMTAAAGNGVATISLSAATDAAGNTVTSAPTSGATFTLDATAPTAAITYSTPGPYAPGIPVTVTATFDEPLNSTPQLVISAPQGISATAMTSVSSTVFTYAMTTASGNGVATISFSAGSDAAGNTVTSAPTSGATFTLDATAPTAAITYSTPGPYAAGAVVTVTATFNEALTGTPQIAISAPQGVSATAMTLVSSTVFTYAMTAAAGNGAATISLSAATDVAGNAVTAAPTSGATFTLDATAPTAAITYSTPGPYKSGASVTVTATFNEAITGTPQIAISAPQGVSATAMTPVTSTVFTYAMTAAAGNSVATISLSSGTDAAGNALASAPSSGATFTLDATAATAAITYSLASPYKSATAVTVTATFNEAITGTPQITISAPQGLSATAMTPVSSTVFTYAMTAASGNGVATISLSAATDAAGNTVTSVPSSGATFTLDATAPTAAITYSTPGPYKPGTAVTVTATFDEPMNSTPQLVISAPQGISATAMTSVSSTVFTYALIAASGNGVATISFSAGSDVAGNTVTSTPSSGATFTLDATAPTAAITYSTPGPYKSGAAVTVTATFNEAITGTPQIAMSAPQGISATAMTPVSSTVFTYAMTAAAGNGVATISLSSGTDAAGNSIAADPSSGATFTLDATEPTAAITYSLASPYKSATAVTVTATFTEAITGTPQIAISAPQGISATAMTPVSSTVFTYAMTAASGNGLATISLSAATDAAGNTVTSAPTSGATFTLDATAPTAAITYSVAGPYKPGALVSVTATFDEPLSVTPQIAISAPQGLSATAMTAVSSTIFTYAMTAAAGNGVATISLSIGSDAAGNVIAAVPSSGATFSLDSIAPTVQTVTRAGSSPLNGGSVDFLVTFSEPVENVSAARFTKTGSVSGAGSVSVTGSANAYLVTVAGLSGDGTVGLTMTTGTIADVSGNALASAIPSGLNQVYTLDNTAPTVVISRLSADPTSAATAQFLLTFSEPVTGVDLTASVATNASMGLAATNLTGTTLASVTSSSSSTYTVTVNTASLTCIDPASLGLNILASTAISDLAGNLFSSAGFTGPLYTVHNPVPNLYLSAGSVIDATVSTYNASSGKSFLAVASDISTHLGNGLQFTAVLTNRPDGADEQINVDTAPGLTVVWDNASSTLTLSGSATVATYVAAIRNLYYLNVDSAPTAGTRVVDCRFTDSASGVSAVAHVSIPVVSAIAPVRLALSGTVNGTIAERDTAVSYGEGSGALAIAPASIIDNRAAVWNSSLYIGQMLSDGVYDLNFNFGGGTYVDAIEVTLSNPAATAFGSAAAGATESLAFTPQAGFVPGSGVTSPGAYVQWSSVPLAAYSVRGRYHNGGTPFDILMTPTTNSNLGQMYFDTTIASGPVEISGGQDALQAATALADTTALPLPNIDAEALLRSLAYTNSSNNPTRYGFQRRVTVTVLRAGETSSTSHVDITIVPTNHAPTVTGPTSYAVSESDVLNSRTVALNGLAIGDIDGNGFTERLTLSVAHGILHITTTTGLTVSGNDSATLVLNGALDGASGALQTALANGNITYRANNLFNGADTLSLTVNDLGHASTGFASPLSTSLAIPLTVNAVNQPATVSVPSQRTMNQGDSLLIANVSIDDPDVGSGLLQAQVSVLHGTVSLSQTTGLLAAFSDGEGSGVPGTLAGLASGNATVTFRGTLSSINNALATMVYRPTTSFYGDHDTVTVKVNDLGGTGVRVGVVPLGVAASTASGSQAWVTTNTVAVVVHFVNADPLLVASTSNPLTENQGITVAYSNTGIIHGGTSVISSYPLVGTPLNSIYTAPIPANAGTLVLSTSNLVAWDQETKDPTGLTYIVTLGVSQGSLLRKRPSDPLTGMKIIAVPVAVDETNSFTQEDLNQDYISYTHLGARSGDDGFVFVVRDDNPQSFPAAFGVPALTDSRQGESAPVVFNIAIDRTLPIVLLSSSTPVFAESIAPAPAIPVLVDSGALLFNPADVNLPTQFQGLGNTGARIIATLSIPDSTMVAVNGLPAVQGDDAADELSLRDSGLVHLGTYDELTDSTPVVYGTSFATGVSIGTLSGGKNGVPLELALASSAAILLSTVEDVVQHLTFVNRALNPSASPRQVRIQVENGARSLSVAVNKTVQVMPYNNPPTLSVVRKILAAPNAPVPFAFSLGTPGDDTVATVADPDGATTYTFVTQPTKGTIAASATPGIFTYTATTPNAGASSITSDQFTVMAVDIGLVSDGVTRVPRSSNTITIQIVIADTGATALVIDSNPPLAAVQGSVLSYTPHVVLPAVGQLGLPPQLSFTLVDPEQLTTPALVFSGGPGGDGTITWPASWSIPASTSLLDPQCAYQKLGILVTDLANETSAYQEILLMVVQPPTGSN
jgi:hypothetical protein